MTGNIVSSITYFDASSFAARTLGEENMAHFPPSKPLQGPVWYEGFSTDFLSENPRSPYGPSRRDSFGDRKAQPVSRWLGERKRSHGHTISSEMRATLQSIASVD